MGIGVQGEPSAEVSQHPGYRFHVYPVLEGQGGIGVAQIVESDPRESRPFQHPVEHMQHTVRENRHTRGAGEHPGAAPRFLPLCLQNAYRILCQRQGAVGVFRFQRCLHHLTVDPGDLPPYPEVTPLQIDVLPLQAEKFSPAEPSSQFQIVELKHAAVLGLSPEGLELLHQQGFHLLVLQLGRGTALRRICGDQFLLPG